MTLEEPEEAKKKLTRGEQKKAKDDSLETIEKNSAQRASRD